MKSTGPEECLRVAQLHVSFQLEEGLAPAVRGVSFSVARQESLGIVGESGCGKSVTSLAVMGLVPSPPGIVQADQIELNGKDLRRLDAKGLRAVRGGEIAMIFQDPMTSLNPVFTCGTQIDEAVTLHRGLSRDQARRVTEEMLGKVGIPNPHECAQSYPHQLSGGMRQRVMIAMALSGEPSLLIADEPTTALDVTVQARILDLLRKLQEEFRMSMIIITHDLGIVSDLAHRVVVMYAGEIVEEAPARALFSGGLHPYTQSLLQTIPTLKGRRERLRVIPGEVPRPNAIPTGCAFHPRCEKCMDVCRHHHPQLLAHGDDHTVRCFLYSSPPEEERVEA